MPDYLLLEDDSYLLLETGTDKLILNDGECTTTTTVPVVAMET